MQEIYLPDADAPINEMDFGDDMSAWIDEMADGMRGVGVSHREIEVLLLCVSAFVHQLATRVIHCPQRCLRAQLLLTFHTRRLLQHRTYRTCSLRHNSLHHKQKVIACS